MAFISFALSLHSLTGNAGSDAGFAAILGLAILALLYFAQARETSSLRDSLKRADDELGSLHERLNAVIAAQAAAAQRTPAPVPPPVVRPMGSAVAAVRQGAGVAALAAPLAARAATQSLSALELPPSAPVGVGAPALSSATKLVPTVVPSSAKAGAVTPALAGAGGTLPPDVTVIGGIAPATAAGGNGNTGQPPTATPVPVAATAVGAGVAAGAAVGVVAAGEASGTAPPFDLERSESPPPAAPPAPARSRESASPRPPAGARSRTAAAGRGRPRRPRSRGARVAPWLIGLAALGIAIAALVIITGGNSPTTTTAAGKTTTQPHTGTTTTSRKHPKAAAFDPSSVTVAVLNGTDTNNLAHDTGLRLAGFGYTEGNIATAASQTQATTSVAYTPGHRADALHVAQSLKLKDSAVTPVDQSTLAVACPQPAPCTADVVVTIGQDLVSAQTSTT